MKEDSKTGANFKNTNHKKKNPKAVTNGKLVEKDNKPKKQFPLVKHQESSKWYDYQVNETLQAGATPLPPEKFEGIVDEAHMLLQNDIYLYNQLLRSQGGSEAAWLQTVVSKGTSGDRMTAMQLQITKSPIHGISFITELVRQCEKLNIRQSMETMPLLEKIFVDELLPDTRKLISFEMRPLNRLNEIASGSEQGRKRLLVLWMFEHELKKTYGSFIKSLELLANGAVETAIFRSVKIISNLLAERPEAEAQLLTSLVNKLGHPNYKVGARVAHLLEAVCGRQPAMKKVVVTEVERLIYRKNINDRAHLYAATFLSQLPFSREDPTLAVQALSIYFGLFKTLVTRKKTEPRLLRILLTASNRAFPFAKDKAEALVSDIDTLYKLVHTSTFTVSLQTLKLLFQVLELSDSFSDRYYTAMYRKLFDQIPPKMFRQFLGLLFKTMKADTMENRVRAMVKRLLQVAVNESAPFAAGILILVSKLAEERPNLILLKRVPSMAISQNLTSATQAFDDDDEVYLDLDDEGKPIQPIKAEITKEEVMDSDVKPDKSKLSKSNPTRGQGWVHKNYKAHRGATSIYSSDARNPLFVASNEYVDMELVLLSKHYHPSIAIFANNILRGQSIKYNGDPLEDFTSIRFLDRFVYKNPRERKAANVNKIIRSKTYDPWGVKKLKIASREYLMKKQEEIPADERFLHRFATLKFQPKDGDKTKEENWDEIGSVNSEEMDQLLEHLEPGEANDEFDIDFKNEFSVEKKQKEKKPQKRQAESDGEDDDLLEEEWDEEDENGDREDEDDLDEDEDDWDDEDIEMEDDESDPEADEGLFSRSAKHKKGDMDDDSDDEDFGEADAFVAADKFAEMLEEGGEDEIKNKIRKKIKKPKGFKRRR